MRTKRVKRTRKTKRTKKTRVRRHAKKTKKTSKSKRKIKRKRKQRGGGVDPQTAWDIIGALVVTSPAWVWGITKIVEWASEENEIGPEEKRAIDTYEKSMEALESMGLRVLFKHARIKISEPTAWDLMGRNYYDPEYSLLERVAGGPGWQVGGKVPADKINDQEVAKEFSHKFLWNVNENRIWDRPGDPLPDYYAGDEAWHNPPPKGSDAANTLDTGLQTNKNIKAGLTHITGSII